MSYMDNIENCNIFEKDHRSLDAYRKGKRSAKLPDNKEIYLTKTLCDPANALSKRYKKKVLAEKSDGFSPNVPYSMNKQKRWDTLTAKKLLSDQEKDLPETVVVHRTDVPLSDGCHAGTVSNVQIIENDAMTTMSSGGRRKPLKYFNDQIRELRQIDKKEIEPARIHFNITTEPSSEKSPSKKAKRTNRRKGVLENFDDDDLKISDPNFVVDEETIESCEKTRSFTLGDYVVPEGKGRQVSEPSQFSRPHCSNSQTTARTSADDVEKRPSIMPVDLLDISEATKAPHIFVIYATKIKSNVEPFSLEEKILKSVPPRLIVTWFGPNRVSVRSPPYFKPIFVLFFEFEESTRILRVRVNTSSPYAEMATKSRLRNLIQNRDWKYDSLLEDLYDFIMKTRKKEEEKPADDSRFVMYPEGFNRDVNTETLAPLAVTFEEQEQIALLSQLYMEDDCDISSFEVVDNLDDSAKCCSVCHISSKKDLFVSVDGLICRDCVKSSIFRQLRFNNSFPDIPISAPPGSSPIDLLYAAIPAPVMSFLVKKLYAYCNPSNSRFVKCHHCHAELATSPDCEFSSCTCSNCGCAFCYHCECEPHWPMSCGEYKRWTDRWDTQYLLEKNHIVGDGQMRLCLLCEEVFQVPYGSDSTRCPGWRCRWEYDDEGNYSHWHGYKRPINHRVLKHAKALGQKIKYCSECGQHESPHTIKLEGLVNRETAKLIAEAHRQRLEKNGKETFVKYVAKYFSSKKEQRKMNETRNLVLCLVENCTAWLYLMKPANSHELKAQISSLFSQLTDIQCQFVDSQRRIPEEKDVFSKRMAKLEELADDLISVFRQYKIEIDLL
ncbi:unnamed protein product [Cylicocyclus nassatus]|uniref:Uncharacterized protein n=1 Tax=Cylicocyclus nassatus TaxID=53992 RepID=A0AA36M684_CYLNA|nr:unnamed protein product [Cylicocyclus nassatus]